VSEDPAPQRRLPTSRIARIVKPAMRSSRAALTFGRGRDMDRVIRSAQQVADVMGEMKGAFMKVGQLLSFADTAMLPPEVREVLATLQADAPPMAYELVAEVVEAELGAPPDQAFDWFSPVPMAAASIGQVHAARVGDDEVVVKVQYPGVADAVAADLNNAGLMAAAVSLVQPIARAYMGRIDVKALAEEIRDRVLEELDYVGEAANQRLFADLYRGDPTIRIPEVYEDRSTGRVLTSAYHDGMRWAAAIEAPKELRDQWGLAISRFAFGSLYREGVANVDPHPGNYLFHEDGAVTFLDFGCVKRLTPDGVGSIRALGRAVLADDAEQFAEAMREGGFLAPDKAVDADRVYAAFRPAYLPVLSPQPYTYSPEETAKMIETNLGLTDEYLAIVRDFALPPDFLFVGRIALGTHSVLSGLRATGDWRSLLGDLWEAA